MGTRGKKVSLNVPGLVGQAHIKGGQSVFDTKAINRSIDMQAVVLIQCILALSKTVFVTTAASIVSLVQFSLQSLSNLFTYD